MPRMTPSSSGPDPWISLSRHTAARIALGRAGGSLRTPSLLDFRLAHASARDAVNASFDTQSLSTEFAVHGIATLSLSTAATDRRTYLLRPDLGRRLDPTSRVTLATLTAKIGPPQLVPIVSDGLAAAATAHAVATLVPLIARLTAARWAISPVCLVPLARVKLQDEIGFLLGARHALMLLGERPGLAAPDSLGAYFTHAPHPARTDSDRNCVSNIRPAGLPPPAAAARLGDLLSASARIGLSGVALKEEAPSLPILSPLR